MKRTSLAAIVACVLLATPALAQVSPPPLPPYVNVGAPFQPIANVYLEDFEANDGGFVAEGNASWEWGQPTTHVQPGVGQGPGMWATNLAGTYNDRACGSITSPAVDLTTFPAGAETGARAARLAFRHWLQAEMSWDGGVVQASTNGVNWTVLTPVGGYDASMISSTVRDCLGTVSGQKVFTGPSGTTLPGATEWSVEEFDLTGYLGTTVQFRWVFATDSSDVRLGWYVDDVIVQYGIGASTRVDIPQVQPANGVAFTPAAILLAEDFEATNGDWVPSGTDAWEWGEAVAPPLPPTGSLNVWGTRLAGDYLSGECAYLTSPAISIPGADPTLQGVETARLTMQVWRHLRSGYDAAAVQVSTDEGATWARLDSPKYDRTISTSSAQNVRDCLGISTTDKVWSGPFSAPKPEDWMNATFDLTDLMGKTIQLRLAFASVASGTVYRGIYVSDLLIEVGAGAAVDPSAPLPVPTLAAPGWTVSPGASWEYGVPQSGPTSAEPVWATKLNGVYPANECSSITSPAVDTNNVVGLGRLELKLEHYHKSDSADDGGVIQVSSDGGATWNLVTPYTGYPTSMPTDADTCLGLPSTGKAFSGSVTGEEYRGIAANLASYQGKTIQVRFVWFADASTQDLGWYIRGVELSRGGVPVPLSMSVEADASKIDASLLAPGAGLVQALVAGHPHDVQGMRALPRAQVVDTLDVLSAPFFESVSTLVEAAGGEVLALHPSVPAVAVMADAATLAALSQRADVTYVAADGPDSVRLVDPVFGIPDEEAGAQNSQGRAMIQAEDAWGAGFMGEGIKISVIDTGIDPSHEAFRYADGSSRVAKFVDFVNDITTPYDDQGHGTHVAGTALGSDLYEHPTRGKFQEVGVAPRATVYVAKFLNSGGSGSFTDAIASLEWSYVEGADITSNSWGSSCSAGARPVMESVRLHTDLGMLSVFAAGNSGSGAGTIGAPACSESALSVGAVNSAGVIAAFSSRGPCSDIEIGGPSRICPDVVAKGVLVRSSTASGSCQLCHPSGYAAYNGTSMATPHVAGASALIEQMRRSLIGEGWNTTMRAEEEIFKLTSLDLGAAGPDNSYGWGLPQLMNVYAILLDTDEANIVPSFSISKTLLRQGDSAALAFGVRNLGGATATGDFRATLTAPNGDVTVLKQSTPSLGLLDGESYAGTFTVTNSVGFGSYTFRGSFDYSWTNSTTGETHTASILREGVIEVKRVQVEVAIDGLADKALPGALQQVRYTATNVGNEDASKVTIEFTVPDDYVFVPGENYDPTKPLTRYADPAPSSVVENPSYGRVTLVFNVGNLTQGSSFSFETNLLPTVPGTYRVVSVAKYFDGANNAFSSGMSRTQVVGV